MTINFMKAKSYRCKVHTHLLRPLFLSLTLPQSVATSNSTENHEWNFSVWRQMLTVPILLTYFYCIYSYSQIYIIYNLQRIYWKMETDEIRLQRFKGSFLLSVPLWAVPLASFMHAIYDRLILFSFFLLCWFAFMMRSSFATLTPTQKLIHLRYSFWFCILFTVLFVYIWSATSKEKTILREREIRRNIKYY